MSRLSPASHFSIGLALVVFGTSLLANAHAHEPMPDTLIPDEIVPADPAPRWWKGNLHTHSLWSDGDDFPEMIAEWYRTAGYNFLALSDHNVLSQGMRWMKVDQIEKRAGRNKHVIDKYLKRFGPHWVETRGSRDDKNFEVRLKPFDEFRSLVEQRGQFLMIPGEEISDRAEGVPLHMNAANLRELLKPAGGTTVREAMENNLRAANEQAKKHQREILVHLNHPNFGYAITAEDLAAVISERFFEVYNGHPSVHNEGDQYRASTDEIWDVANTIRIAKLAAPPLYGLGSDDSHDYHGHEGSVPGRGWIMVRARHLTPESLIRAIEQGDFYASSGVTLRDIRFDPKEKKLQLEIEPEGDATYTTRFVGTQLGYDDSSQPRHDDKGKKLRTTRKYSADVGKTLATVEGTSPSYQLTGNELYVRAIVTSSLEPERPVYKGQRRQAWTQPVGWEKHLPSDKP